MAADSKRQQARSAAARVHRFNVEFEAWVSQIRRSLSINAHERLALAHLWEAGPLTMTELGERIPLSRAAVTALTDRLERLDYLRRTADPNDRRRTMISVTDTPRALVEPLYRPLTTELEDYVAKMDPEEWESVQRFLAEVGEMFVRHSQELRRQHRVAKRGAELAAAEAKRSGVGPAQS